MFRLWTSHFFKDDNLNAIPFIIPKSSWEAIGIQMQNNKKNMPLSFGRPSEIYLSTMQDIKQKNGPIGQLFIQFHCLKLIWQPSKKNNLFLYIISRVIKYF